MNQTNSNLTPIQAKLMNMTSSQLFNRYLLNNNNPNGIVNFKKEFEDQVNSYYAETNMNLHPILYALKPEDLDEVFFKLNEVANFLDKSKYKFNARALAGDVETLLKEKEIEVLKNKSTPGKTKVVVDIAKFFSEKILLEKIIIPLKESSLIF